MDVQADLPPSIANWEQVARAIIWPEERDERLGDEALSPHVGKDSYSCRLLHMPFHSKERFCAIVSSSSAHRLLKAWGV